MQTKQYFDLILLGKHGLEYKSFIVISQSHGWSCCYLCLEFPKLIENNIVVEGKDQPSTTWQCLYL